jgi:hypothetical protein
MKQQWIVEQMEEYNKLSISEIKERIIEDLKEAIKWFEDGDYDSAYRLAGGATQAMFKNDMELFNTK